LLDRQNKVEYFGFLVNVVVLIITNN
jgi:hypothetical protein